MQIYAVNYGNRNWHHMHRSRIAIDDSENTMESGAQRNNPSPIYRAPLIATSLFVIDS